METAGTGPIFSFPMVVRSDSGSKSGDDNGNVALLLRKKGGHTDDGEEPRGICHGAFGASISAEIRWSLSRQDIGIMVSCRFEMHQFSSNL